MNNTQVVAAFETGIAIAVVIVFGVWVLAWLAFWALEEPQEEQKDKSEAHDV